MKYHISWSTPILLKLSLISLFAAALALSMGWTTAHAALTNGPDIISAPASIADDAPGAENDHQQAFDEAQDVTLANSYRCDDNVILPRGARVNSHMIFLNTDGTALTEDKDVTWAFDGDIICVMSDSGGAMENASNPELGAASTAYPGSFAARGMEGDDSYNYVDNEITVSMHVTEPGDWIRVVTEWVDTTPPGIACVEAVNPHGEQKPQAPGTGQNEDGFYQLLGRDAEGPVQLFVTDSGSGTVFGPFVSGTIMKYTEANGAEPGMKEMGSNNGKGNGKAAAVDYKINGTGDAILIAYDAAGNAARTQCLVPNPPK